MALMKCPECGKDVSSAAVSCPHCGYPIGKYVANLRAGHEKMVQSGIAAPARELDAADAAVDADKKDAEAGDTPEKNEPGFGNEKADLDLKSPHEGGDSAPVWAGEPGKYDHRGDTEKQGGNVAVKKEKGNYTIYFVVAVLLVFALFVGIIKSVSDKAAADRAIRAATEAGNYQGTVGYESAGVGTSGGSVKSGSYRLDMGGSTRITLGYTEEAFNDFLDCCASGDTDGASNLILTGKTFRVDSGTSCTIEDYGFSISKVKITSGAHEGKIGYTASDALKK